MLLRTITLIIWLITILCGVVCLCYLRDRFFSVWLWCFVLVYRCCPTLRPVYRDPSVSFMYSDGQCSKNKDINSSWLKSFCTVLSMPTFKGLTGVCLVDHHRLTGGPWTINFLNIEGRISGGLRPKRGMVRLWKRTKRQDGVESYLIPTRNVWKKVLFDGV